MTLMFYSQHSVGIGHYVRSLTLARALSARFQVVLLNGGPPPQGIPMPEGIERIDLLPIGMNDEAALVSLTPGVDVRDAMAMRSQQMRDVLRARTPDVLVVELFPFGRKKFGVELVPLLDAAHTMGSSRPLVVSSVRDLLVTTRLDQQRFDDQARTYADRYFDVVLVHADSAFASFDESFHPSTPMQVPVVHTGFLAPPAPDSPGARRGLVVSAGGGLVGEPLFVAAVAAQERIWSELHLPMTIVAGPCAPPAVVDWMVAQAASRPGLEVLPHVPDLTALLARAQASISQCGYNTALDVIRAKVPALMVPYAPPREDEQTRRASRLAARGLVRMMAADALDARTLVCAVRDLLAFTPSAAGVRVDGGDETLRAIVDRLGALRGASLGVS
jgi:predicted glycosyltransferase